MREAGGDRAGEELPHRLAEPAAPGPDDDQPRLRLLGEVLDGQRRVSDELMHRPVDTPRAGSTEGCRRGIRHGRQLRLARRGIQIYRGGVDVAVGVLVGDEARDVDVRHDQRRSEELRVARRFFQHPRRLVGDRTDDHRVQRNLCRATLCHVALSARIAPSGPQNREGHKAPCYPECYSSRPLAES